MDDVNWWAVAVEGVVSGLVVALGVALTAAVAGLQRRRQAVEEAFHRASKVHSRVVAGFVDGRQTTLSDPVWVGQHDELWDALGAVRSHARRLPRAKDIRAAVEPCLASLSALMLDAFGQDIRRPPPAAVSVVMGEEFRDLSRVIFGDDPVLGLEMIDRRREMFDRLPGPRSGGDLG